MENKNVLSQDQCKKLIKLGLNMENASIYWIINTKNARGKSEDLIPPYLSFHKNPMKVGMTSFEIIPTYTLQDIIDTMWSWTEYDFCAASGKAFLIDLYDSGSTTPFKIITSNSTIDAAYELLIWCLKNINNENN